MFFFDDFINPLVPKQVSWSSFRKLDQCYSYKCNAMIYFNYFNHSVWIKLIFMLHSVDLCVYSRALFLYVLSMNLLSCQAKRLMEISYCIILFHNIWKVRRLTFCFSILQLFVLLLLITFTPSDFFAASIFFCVCLKNVNHGSAVKPAHLPSYLYKTVSSLKHFPFLLWSLLMHF